MAKKSEQVNKSNKFVVTLAVVTVILTAGVVTTFAYSDTHIQVREGAHNQNNRPEILEAIENNDYETWRKLTRGKDINEKITEENFSKMVEMHRLMQAGKTDEANQIRKELGMMFRPNGHRGNNGMIDPAQREAAEAAVRIGDYNAWLDAVGEDCPMLDKINAGNFPRFVEMHDLMDQARRIGEELGIERPGNEPVHHTGMGRGMGLPGKYRFQAQPQ